MAAETQYTANTGMVNISTANSNLDGTGTLGAVLTAASNGTLIKSVTCKALVSTTEGTLRLYVYDGTSTRLIQEIHVPSNTKSGTNPAFEYTWNCDIPLKAGNVLKASTQNAESFNIIAQGLDWAYYSTSVRPESTNFTANTGLALVSTANSNLDGTGTLATLITAGVSGSGWKGLRIERISIKAQVNTTMGMFRIFAYDGTTARLLAEVPVSPVTKSGAEPSFHSVIDLGNFQLQAGYSLKGSTENAEAFSVVVEANDWKYPA
jgi:hypothetical protein